MPAASKAIKMSWIPRGDSKGGYFSNATYHDMVPDSTYTLSGAYVKANAWTPFLNGTAVQTGLPGFITTLDIFNRYSGNSQALTSSIISGITDDGAGKSRVVNSTTTAIIRSSATAQPTTGTGRHVFAPVKNRLYMANGTDIPVISPDASAGSCIPWGFNPQTPNLTYQIASPGTGANAGVLGGTQGTCNVAGTTVTSFTGPNFQYFQVNAPIYINGVLCQITTWTNATTIVVSKSAAIANGNWPFSYAPTGLNSATTTYTTANGNFAAWAAGLPLNATTGTLTAVIPGNPLYVAVGGVAATITPSVKYGMTAVTGAATGTFTPVEAEAALAGTVRNSQINTSNISFEGAVYQYGVSYYNPTSGHVTNLSPILAVPNGAPNNNGVSVTISNIVCTNDTAYTKIILWRSAKGGSNLFPLFILNNDTGNAAGNTITYTDFLGDDTALGTASNGPGKVVAPRGENSPPPVDLNYIAYWDGRFWGTSQTQIGLLFFSGRSAGNNEDISVGVAEECWPLNFTRAVPEADGRITGLRTVGNNLFVLTDNNIYAVVGNAQTNYGLSRVSSKGNGAAHFATCVLPAEDVNSTDVMVHYGNDRRIYFLFGSGGDFCISYPIQNELDALGWSSASANLSVWHTSVSTFVVLTFPGSYRYMYDVERKIWLKTLFQYYGTGMCEGLYSGALVQLYTDGPGSALKGVGLDNQAVGSPLAYTLYTNIVSPGGPEHQKDEKVLQSVVIYTNDPANLSVLVGVDGKTPVGLTAVPTTGQYSAYREFGDAYTYVLNASAGAGTGSGRLFQFVIANAAPNNFTSAIYQITATWSLNQSAEAIGAAL